MTLKQPPRPDVLRDALGATVARDPELQTRLTKIMSTILDDVERTLKIGDPRDRAALVRAIVPNLLRTASESRADDEDERAAYERMKALLRGDPTSK